MFDSSIGWFYEGSNIKDHMSSFVFTIKYDYFGFWDVFWVIVRVDDMRVDCLLKIWRQTIASFQGGFVENKFGVVSATL